MHNRALVGLLLMLNFPILAADTNAAPMTPSTMALIANARAVAASVELLVTNGNDFTHLERLGERGAHEAIGRVLDRHTLFRVNINPELRVKVNQGGATARLVPGEWTFFLARIENESGTTAPLQINLPPPANVPKPVAWLEAEVVGRTNLPVTLSGAPLEYRLVRLRSREIGRREARISLHVGQGTQDLGFRNEVDILFNSSSKPAVPDKPQR